MRIGLLVPHFGLGASRRRIVDVSSRAEHIGFRSFWVRDHLIWEPHGMEGTDRTFLDPFVTLAAIAGVTTQSWLGTAVAIPVRWPLKLAHDYASLSFLNGGRVLAGVGLGYDPREFAAAGLDPSYREEIFEETTQILRQAWSGKPIAHHGTVFDVDGVALAPVPVEEIPIIYGGDTPKAVRRAVDVGDGWHPGRLPIDTLKDRLRYLSEIGGAKAQDMQVIVQPLVVFAENRNEAERLIPIAEVAKSSSGTKYWLQPESGSFSTIDDLQGIVCCGSVSELVDQISAFGELGIDEFVVDLRLQFDRYEELVSLIGEEVLPQLPTSPEELPVNPDSVKKNIP